MLCWFDVAAGVMQVTNLRLIWFDLKKRSINLCACVVSSAITITACSCWAQLHHLAVHPHRRIGMSLVALAAAILARYAIQYHEEMRLICVFST